MPRLAVALAAVLVPFAFLCVPGYPILQAFLCWKLRGPSRLLSALPRDSNLWPLCAIFASPVAFTITLTVFLIARSKARARSV